MNEELKLVDKMYFKDSISAKFWFHGSANLGIVFSDELLLNFSSGKLQTIRINEQNDKKFYNSLVGPTEFPELAEEISQQHIKYQLELAEKDDFINFKDCQKLYDTLFKPSNAL